MALSSAALKVRKDMNLIGCSLDVNFILEVGVPLPIPRHSASYCLLQANCSGVSEIFAKTVLPLVWTRVPFEFST